MNIQFKRPKRQRDVYETPNTPGKIIRTGLDSTKVEESFLRELQHISPSSVVYSSLIPVTRTTPTTPVICKLPPPLTALRRDEYTTLSHSDLSAAYEAVFKSHALSWEECVYLEESTRLQSQSRLWFEHRVGRITASKFAAVSRASLEPPPSYLMKQLMERERSQGHVQAIRWGIDNEDVARVAYLELADENHVGLKYSADGLHLNPSFPHLGASPDGLISCDCCGSGIIEIKCPYKYRDESPQDVQDPKFYLEFNDEGELHLSKSHEYYYQVQGQLSVCEKDYVCYIYTVYRNVVRDSNFACAKFTKCILYIP